MKICAISDTHNKHNKINIPECDILICSGDISLKGEESEIKNFSKWFDKQPAKQKILVPGNHELSFEKNLPMSKQWFYDHCPTGILLIHEMIEIEGLKIFGSPYTPEFHNWAFNVPRGPEIKRLWEQIPEDIDILITHGPPAGILDICYFADGVTARDRVGCQDLMDKIMKLEKLKYHFFGHIHGSNGFKEFNGKHFHNVSICDERYLPSNEVRIVEV